MVKIKCKHNFQLFERYLDINKPFVQVQDYRFSNVILFVCEKCGVVKKTRTKKWKIN